MLVVLHARFRSSRAESAGAAAAALTQRRLQAWVIIVITIITLLVPAEARCVWGKSSLARQACSEHHDNDGPGSNAECHTEGHHSRSFLGVIQAEYLVSHVSGHSPSVVPPVIRPPHLNTAMHKLAQQHVLLWRYTLLQPLHICQVQPFRSCCPPLYAILCLHSTILCLPPCVMST